MDTVDRSLLDTEMVSPYNNSNEQNLTYWIYNYNGRET
jgi:hypothetical protein